MSGFNTLNIGASYESMMRWLGRGNRVMAMSKNHVPFRKDEDGYPTSVTIPDHVDILYELANGAQVHMKMSATSGLNGGSHIWMFGTEGTIHVDGQRKVWAGKRGDGELTEVPNPPETPGQIPGGSAVHQRHTGQRKGGHGGLRDRGPLHGVVRSGTPQRHDGTGGVPAPLARPFLKSPRHRRPRLGTELRDAALLFAVYLVVKVTGTYPI